MTISIDEVTMAAPSVAVTAQRHSGYTNPYVSFTSLEAQCQGNETLDFCLREMVICSLRYAETVCRFEQIVKCGQISNEDGMRKEIESLRHIIHEATIDSINRLSRSLKGAGKDNKWISKITASGGREAYGKFAILIAFEVILMERRQ